MRVVRVELQDVDEALRRLLEADVVERSLKVARREGHGLIPLRAEMPSGTLDGIGHSLDDVHRDALDPRDELRTPHQRIVREAQEEGWDPTVVDLLPDRWERLGRLVILDLPPGLATLERVIAGLYARTLGVEAVLVAEGPVTGVERRPGVRLVWGEGTVTVHREHGVEYEFDATRQMFSKGNVHERLRMGRTVLPGETVVDMFAGIGYFTLPMSVLGDPSMVHACEIDPEAHGYLSANADRNRVSDVVDPILGDCREVAPRGVADRVVMGYVGGTEDYLDVAMEVLSEDGGVVHLHEKYGIDEVPERPMMAIVAAASRAGREARLLGWREVKSYAPSIVHAVVDFQVR